MKVLKKVEVQERLCVHANAVQPSRSGHIKREFVAESKKERESRMGKNSAEEQ